MVLARHRWEKSTHKFMLSPRISVSPGDHPLLDAVPSVPPNSPECGPAAPRRPRLVSSFELGGESRAPCRCVSCHGRAVCEPFSRSSMEGRSYDDSNSGKACCTCSAQCVLSGGNSMGGGTSMFCDAGESPRLYEFATCMSPWTVPCSPAEFEEFLTEMGGVHGAASDHLPFFSLELPPAVDTNDRSGPIIATNSSPHAKFLEDKASESNLLRAMFERNSGTSPDRQAGLSAGMGSRMTAGSSQLLETSTDSMSTNNSTSVVGNSPKETVGSQTSYM